MSIKFLFCECNCCYFNIIYFKLCCFNAIYVILCYVNAIYIMSTESAHCLRLHAIFITSDEKSAFQQF